MIGNDMFTILLAFLTGADRKSIKREVGFVKSRGPEYFLSSVFGSKGVQAP